MKIHHPVLVWTRLTDGVAEGNIAFSATLECGHTFEYHGPNAGLLMLPTVVRCMVCLAEADKALTDAAKSEPT